MDHAIEASSISDKIYQKAALYNNAACKQVKDENYDRAIRLFTTAICFCKKASTIENKEKKFVEIPAVRSVDAFMGRFIEKSGTKIQSLACNTSDNNNNISIYNCPIQLRTNTKFGPSMTEFSHLLQAFQDCLPTIIFFNLGLAYHLLGVQEKRLSFLKQAVNMYEQCFLVERIRCKNLFVSPFLLAAILSNIGHIKQGTKDIKQAEAYFQKLFSMLTYLAQVKRIKQSDFSTFFENSAIGLSLISERCAGAA